MKKLLIIKTGGTFDEYAAEQGDLEHWTARGMELDTGQWECVDVQAGERLPAPAGYIGCAITGSHDMVTDNARWIRDASAWVSKAVDARLPMLGICFGHQLMADALGGKAGYHPNGLEIGTAIVTRTEASDNDPLFSTLPKVFPGHVTHSQTALAIPPGAALLATGSHDPHQAFRVGENAWGVQFHPEFDVAAILHYIDLREETIAEQGLDVDAVRKTVKETPESASILKRFADYCRNL
jgi:GMP synthase (glutamine-hydrolysing)